MDQRLSGVHLRSLCKLTDQYDGHRLLCEAGREDLGMECVRYCVCFGWFHGRRFAAVPGQQQACQAGRGQEGAPVHLLHWCCVLPDHYSLLEELAGSCDHCHVCWAIAGPVIGFRRQELRLCALPQNRGSTLQGSSWCHQHDLFDAWTGNRCTARCHTDIRQFCRFAVLHLLVPFLPLLEVCHASEAACKGNLSRHRPHCLPVNF